VPDLAVFRIETLVEKEGYFHSAPDLVVEVLSPANSRRERQEKLVDYAESEPRKYGSYPPEARAAEVLVLEDGQLIRAAFLANGDTLRPKLFASIRVEIAQIWRD
jgi:Uma2 family endonuclease